MELEEIYNHKMKLQQHHPQLLAPKLSLSR